jgi:Cu+-exporting ATPase
LAIDPVCGMAVNEEHAKHISVHEGKTYYFCKGICKERFEAAPQYYLKTYKWDAP